MPSNLSGTVVSARDWCETNYVYSAYVAEFFNTVSNIPCILLALFGLLNSLRQRFEKRFYVLYISNVILSIGSIVYHATLQQLQQQADETPMVWEMLLYIYILYSPDWHYQSTMPTFMFLYSALFGITHWLFHFDIVSKLHYVLLCLLCIPRMYKYYIHTEDIAAKRVAKLYAITLLLASFFWLLDRLLCHKISSWSFNPQGHALWHVLMGFNSYYANIFLTYCRAQQRGWDPKVVYFLGFLPCIKTQKRKLSKPVSHLLSLLW